MASARWLLTFLDLRGATPAERRATFWTAAMFCAAMASTSVLRPLRDQFGVHEGAERMPYLYALTLAVTAGFAPLFWWLADRLPSRRFVAWTLHVAALAVALLGLALQLVGTYDWQAPGARWVGESFWGFYSAFNVAIPTLVWIHAVELFRRDQGLRLFGMIGVGGTLGAVLGSTLARELAASLPPSSAAVACLVLLEVTFLCHRRSGRAGAVMHAAQGAPPGERVARGGVFAALRLLAHDRHLLAIAGYMLLLGMVATAFAVAQTELVGRQVATARAQHGWLAHVELISQSLVLTLQLLCTGRLLQRLPATLFLCLMPLLSALALGALAIWPTVAAIATVQIVRRGAQYAFEKPAREVLYTPLDLEQKRKVKFVLDTFAFRAGDLLGALFQVHLLRGLGLGAGGIALATVALAATWALFGLALGRRSGRAARA